MISGFLQMEGARHDDTACSRRTPVGERRRHPGISVRGPPGRQRDLEDTGYGTCGCPRGESRRGDDQADRNAHGGPDKAVYAYAAEDLRWWEHELGRSLGHGEFGENFTTEDIDVNGALVGERWEIGNAVFEVSEPRVPCWRLGARMEDKLFPRRFTQAGRPGAYLRIVVEGCRGRRRHTRRRATRPRHDGRRRVSHLYTRSARHGSAPHGAADAVELAAMGGGPDEEARAADRRVQRSRLLLARRAPAPGAHVLTSLVRGAEGPRPDSLTLPRAATATALPRACPGSDA